MAQTELRDRYDIQSMPVLVYIKNGKTIKKEKGLKTPEQIKNSVSKYLK